MISKFKVEIENGNVYIDGPCICSNCYDPHAIGRAIEKYLIDHKDDEDIKPTLEFEEDIRHIRGIAETLDVRAEVEETLAKYDIDKQEFEDHIIAEKDNDRVNGYKNCITKLNEVADFLGQFPYIDPDDPRFDVKDE